MNYSRRALLRTFAATLPACSPWANLLQSLTLQAEDEQLPPVRAITRGPKFHWRGYYDKQLFDSTNRYVLANEVDFEGRSPKPDDRIRVGMVDLKAGDTWIELGETRAWNWQQGCMLQWLPKTEEVAWNDRTEDHFVSHYLNVTSGHKRTLPHPFYCFSPNGQWSFAPDFRRLNDTRPGYGYCGVPDPNAQVRAPENAGLWRMNVNTGEQSLIFSFAQAAAIPFTGRPEAAFKSSSKHWFNHLLCNPTGTRLFFLHRWHAPEDKAAFYTRAFTINLDGTDPYVLDPYGGTSHFVWRDERTIFAWAWHPSHQDRFYTYEDRTDRVSPVGLNVMTQNGHNTYLPGTENQWVLNDTYPDKQGLQHPYLFHIPSERRVPLGHFLSPREYRGEWRCDNHPCASRNGRYVTIDSPHQGGRQVYLIDVSRLLS